MLLLFIKFILVCNSIVLEDNTPFLHLTVTDPDRSMNSNYIQCFLLQEITVFACYCTLYWELILKSHSPQQIFCLWIWPPPAHPKEGRLLAPIPLYHDYCIHYKCCQPPPTYSPPHLIYTPEKQLAPEDRDYSTFGSFCPLNIYHSARYREGCQ